MHFKCDGMCNGGDWNNDLCEALDYAKRKTNECDPVIRCDKRKKFQRENKAKSLTFGTRMNEEEVYLNDPLAYLCSQIYCHVSDFNNIIRNGIRWDCM